MANEMSEVVKQQLAGRRGENRNTGVRQPSHGTLVRHVPRTAEKLKWSRRLFLN
jgi:hypothetical protein